VVPTVAEYYISVQLLVDEDVDSGVEIMLPPQRSDPVTRAAAPGEAGFDHLADQSMECRFELEQGSFDGLQVRDPRLCCKIVAIDPGNSSMLPVASDVFGVNMELINGAAGRVAEARMFSGSAVGGGAGPKYFYGRYIIEVARRAMTTSAFDGQSSGVSQPWAATIVEEPTQLSFGGTLDSDGEEGDPVAIAAAEVAAAAAQVTASAAAAAAAAAATAGGGGVSGMLAAAGSPAVGTEDDPNAGFILAFVVHRATDLPTQFETPQPQVRVYSNVSDRVLAHCPPTESATTIPVWHASQEVFLEPSEITTTDDVAMEVVDHLTGSVIVSFPIPLAHLQPYHQYNLELVRTDAAVGNPRLYATLSLRPTGHVPVPGRVLLELELDALELKAPVQAFQETERVLAIARLVSNLDEHTARLAGSEGAVRSTWVVTVPEAVQADFAVAGYGGVKGGAESASQVVLQAPLTRAPVFEGQRFFFHERVYAVVSPTAGLAIEYYAIPAANSTSTGEGMGYGMEWEPTYTQLQGYSALKLDQKFRRDYSGETSSVVLPVVSSGWDPTAVLRLAVRKYELAADGSYPLDGALAADDELVAVGGGAGGNDSADGGMGGGDGGGGGGGLGDGGTPVHTPPYADSAAGSPVGLGAGAGGGVGGTTTHAQTPEALMGATLGAPLRPSSRSNTPTSLGDLAKGGLGATYTAPSHQQQQQQHQQQMVDSGALPSKPLAKGEREVLLAEISQKQDVITRLQAELDKRMSAIRDLTKELLAHRDSIVKAKTSRAELLRELAQNQEAAKVTIQQKELTSVARDVLEKSYAEMSVRHSVEANRLKEYGARIPDLQNRLIERNELEKRHLRLESVHRHQGQAILRLQERVAKVEKYAAAARSQLLVVSKLEDTLARQDAPHGIGGIDPECTINSERYRRLDARNKTLHAQLALLSSSDGGGRSAGGNGGGPSDPIKAELLAVLAENETMAQENMGQRAGEQIQSEDDLQHLFEASELTERIASLKQRISSEIKQHAQRMAEIRPTSAALGGAAFFRKERSITLDDPPDPPSTLPTTASPPGSGGRSMSPRTQALYDALIPGR
jgi:hypothetical protein